MSATPRNLNAQATTPQNAYDQLDKAAASGESLLGVLRLADFNTIDSQLIELNANRCIVTAVIVENPSVALDTAEGGIVTSEDADVIAPTTTYAALVDSSSFSSPTVVLATVVEGVDGADANLHFQIVTPQGEAATATIR